MCGSLQYLRSVTSFFLMLSIIHAAGAMTCEELQCQNGNPCQAVLDRHGNVTHASCVCTGKWAGPLCQHVIRLQPSQVTSSQATFHVDLITTHDGPKGSSPLRSSSTATSSSPALSLVYSPQANGETKFNYTLVYWRRNETVTSWPSDALQMTSGEVTCVLLHERNSARSTVRGLEAGTLYTVCVENGFVDSCVLSSFTDSFSRTVSSLPSLAMFQAARDGVKSSWPSNCVTILTPSESQQSDVIAKSTTVTAVAVTSVFVLGTLVLVFLVFLLRRQSVSVRLVVDGAFRRCCCCCKCVRCAEEPDSCNNSEVASSSHVSHYSFHTDSSSLAPNYTPDSLLSDSQPKSKHRTLARLFKPRKKTKKEKKQKSSSYASASMLLPPSATPQDGPDENSPLGAELRPFGGADIDDEDVLDEASGCGGAASASDLDLPGINKRRGKGHRLSRKRRGYVAYTTKKDKNIKLTTVLEMPLDDVEPCDVGVSDGDVEMTI